MPEDTLGDASDSTNVENIEDVEDEQPVLETTDSDQDTVSEKDNGSETPDKTIRAANDPREVRRREREAELRSQGVSVPNTDQSSTD